MNLNHNIYYGECPLLHTHLKNGATQGRTTLIKDNNLYHLDGNKRIKSGEYINFKNGWYNDRLEFISEVTAEEQEYINNLPPF